MALNQVAFYHLQKTGVLDSLPALVDKIYGLKLNAFIYHTDKTVLSDLDKTLWTYTPLSFIPHEVVGAEQEVDYERAPIALCNDLNKLNNSNVFIALTDYKIEAVDSKTDRVVDMFDGRQDQDVQHARDRWQAYAAKKVPCVYWTQSPAGKWEKTFEKGI